MTSQTRSIHWTYYLVCWQLAPSLSSCSKANALSKHYIRSEYKTTKPSEVPPVTVCTRFIRTAISANHWRPQTALLSPDERLCRMVFLLMDRFWQGHWSWNRHIIYTLPLILRYKPITSRRWTSNVEAKSKLRSRTCLRFIHIWPWTEVTKGCKV